MLMMVQARSGRPGDQDPMGEIQKRPFQLSFNASLRVDSRIPASPLVSDPHCVAIVLLSQGARNVVVKLGERGAYMQGNAVPNHLVPAFPVKAVDTTAAGDVFNAAFAVGPCCAEMIREGRRALPAPPRLSPSHGPERRHRCRLTRRSIDSWTELTAHEAMVRSVKLVRRHAPIVSAFSQESKPNPGRTEPTDDPLYS